MSERKHTVVVKPLPRWVNAARLLGTEAVELSSADGDTQVATLSLSAHDAADVAARLRALGIDGRPIDVEIKPPLSRNDVREGRTREARARRDTTAGFLRHAARATGEGHYSLTPEVLALELGALAKGRRVIDACCGSGGNTIGFARAGCHVTAVELDRERLDEARHNARVYGVADRIQFIQGDVRELIGGLSADILFIDPPWGREFDKRRTDLDSFPLLRDLLGLCERFDELWIKVPMSFATHALGDTWQIDVMPFFGSENGDFHRIKFLLVRALKRVDGAV